MYIYIYMLYICSVYRCRVGECVQTRIWFGLVPGPWVFPIPTACWPQATGNTGMSFNLTSTLILHTCTVSLFAGLLWDHQKSHWFVDYWQKANRRHVQGRLGGEKERKRDRKRGREGERIHVQFIHAHAHVHVHACTVYIPVYCVCLLVCFIWSMINHFNPYYCSFVRICG